LGPPTILVEVPNYTIWGLQQHFLGLQQIERQFARTEPCVRTNGQCLYKLRLMFVQMGCVRTLVSVRTHFLSVQRRPIFADRYSRPHGQVFSSARTRRFTNMITFCGRYSTPKSRLPKGLLTSSSSSSASRLSIHPCPST
jgi:hypothetical protein